MTRLRIAPTKSALLNLRKQVRFLVDGHALLERKRELLTRLVYQHIKEYQGKKGTAHAALRKAYRWLAIAQLRMGDRSIAQATLGATPSTSMKVLPRRALGVQYPSVEAAVVAPQPVGLLGTDPSFDEARKSFAEAAVRLAELAALQGAPKLLAGHRSFRHVHAREAPGDFGKDHVPGTVSQTVVDVLEVVQVDEEDGEPEVAITLASFDELPDAILEQVAVGELCQPVMICAVARLGQGHVHEAQFLVGYRCGVQAGAGGTGPEAIFYRDSPEG